VHQLVNKKNFEERLRVLKTGELKVLLWALYLLGSEVSFIQWAQLSRFLTVPFYVWKETQQYPKRSSQNVAFYQRTDKVLLQCHSNTFLQSSP